MYLCHDFTGKFIFDSIASRIGGKQIAPPTIKNIADTSPFCPSATAPRDIASMPTIHLIVDFVVDSLIFLDFCGKIVNSKLFGKNLKNMRMTV